MERGECFVELLDFSCYSIFIKSKHKSDASDACDLPFAFCDILMTVWCVPIHPVKRREFLIKSTDGGVSRISVRWRAIRSINSFCVGNVGDQLLGKGFNQ